MDDELGEGGPAPPSAPGASKKVEQKPKPAPTMKCADCGKKFTSRYDTRWDVHLGGGSYATVCTACFEKRDSGWPTPTKKPVKSGSH